VLSRDMKHVGISEYLGKRLIVIYTLAFDLDRLSQEGIYRT
jgi:hypothetical protein